MAYCWQMRINLANHLKRFCLEDKAPKKRTTINQMTETKVGTYFWLYILEVQFSTSTQIQLVGSLVLSLQLRRWQGLPHSRFMGSFVSGGGCIAGFVSGGGCIASSGFHSRGGWGLSLELCQHGGEFGAVSDATNRKLKKLLCSSIWEIKYNILNPGTGTKSLRERSFLSSNWMG